MFSTINIANVGKRGRPPHPKAHSVIHERLLAEHGGELGELVVAESGGGLLLTAVVGGRKKTITFPPVAAPARTRRARKAVAVKTTAAKRGRPRKATVKSRRAGVKVFA